MDTQKTPPGAAAIDLLLQTCLTAPTKGNTPAPASGKQTGTPATSAKQTKPQTKQPSAPAPVWRGPWWH